MADSGFTEANDLAYIRFAWRGAYVVNPPATPGGRWQAVATFGARHTLEADDAEGLLYKIRKHYPGLIDRSVAVAEP
jgi:hypothetical protein